MTSCMHWFHNFNVNRHLLFLFSWTIWSILISISLPCSCAHIVLLGSKFPLAPALWWGNWVINSSPLAAWAVLLSFVKGGHWRDTRRGRGLLLLVLMCSSCGPATFLQTGWLSVAVSLLRLQYLPPLKSQVEMWLPLWWYWGMKSFRVFRV